jgi:hypothetical protein
MSAPPGSTRISELPSGSSVSLYVAVMVGGLPTTVSPAAGDDDTSSECAAAPGANVTEIAATATTARKRDGRIRGVMAPRVYETGLDSAGDRSA